MIQLDVAANSSYSQCDLLNNAAMALNEYRDCRQLMSLAGYLRPVRAWEREMALALPTFRVGCCSNLPVLTNTPTQQDEGESAQHRTTEN